MKPNKIKPCKKCKSLPVIKMVLVCPECETTAKPDSSLNGAIENWNLMNEAKDD